MCWPRCTLRYAAPEVVIAARIKQDVTVRTAHDMWALGVIGYECITQSAVLVTTSEVIDCASGEQNYPWEEPDANQPQAWRRSPLRPLLTTCLQRRAPGRPAAADVIASVAAMGRHDGR